MLERRNGALLLAIKSITKMLKDRRDLSSLEFGTESKSLVYYYKMTAQELPRSTALEGGVAAASAGTDR